MANSVGNLANRALNLLLKNCAAALPAASASVPASDPLRAFTESKVGGPRNVSYLSVTQTFPACVWLQEACRAT